MIHKKLKRWKSFFLGLSLLSVLSMQDLHAQEPAFSEKVADGLIYVGKHMAVLGASLAVVGSVMIGVENLKIHDVLLQIIEVRYGLVPQYDWYQLPGHYLVQTLCNNGYQTENLEVNQVITAIQQKVAKKSDTELFNFPLFVQKMPHTDQAGLYCIAKSYFNDYKCVTLGDLKENIDDYIKVIEDDFKELKTLTNLSNKSVVPTTLQEFNVFKAEVLQGMQSPIINSSLGIFGYSALHNGERVKTCIIAIAKYHAYLVLLQELFAACIDDNSTILQNDSGVLHFTLQHINYNQSVKIN
jgi:hypothetical protein